MLPARKNETSAISMTTTFQRSMPRYGGESRLSVAPELVSWSATAPVKKPRKMTMLAAPLSASAGAEGRRGTSIPGSSFLMREMRSLARVRRKASAGASSPATERASRESALSFSSDHLSLEVDSSARAKRMVSASSGVRRRILTDEADDSDISVDPG